MNKNKSYDCTHTHTGRKPIHDTPLKKYNRGLSSWEAPGGEGRRNRRTGAGMGPWDSPRADAQVRTTWVLIRPVQPEISRSQGGLLPGWGRITAGQRAHENPTTTKGPMRLRAVNSPWANPGGSRQDPGYHRYRRSGYTKGVPPTTTGTYLKTRPFLTEQKDPEPGRRKEGEPKSG